MEKFTPVSISITGGVKTPILMWTKRKDFRDQRNDRAKL